MPLKEQLQTFVYFWRRHFSEQYLTSSQHLAHFLRHVKDKPQTGQILVGKSDFFLCFAIFVPNY